MRLCQLPPRRQPPQTHGRPHAQYACASGPRTYKGKRSRDCVRRSRPQTLAGLSPLAPQGENNHPGEGIPVRASVPRIRRHNIIPSELCNSRRHWQCPASRESAKHTPGARKTALQGVRLHNSDYVKEAPASRCEGPAFELPGEAAEDKQPPSRTSGLQARQGAAHFAHLRGTVSASSGIATPAVGTAASDFRFEARIRGQEIFQGAKCRARSPASKGEGRVLAFSLSAVRRVLRLMQHSCGSARHRTSAVQRSWPAHVRHRSSKVAFNLAAIPPGTFGLPLRRQPQKSLPGIQGTARWAVGAACSHRHQGFHRHPVRTPCASVALFPGYAFIVHPPREPCHGPFRPGAGRPSVHRTSCRSLSGSGSLRSPSPCTAKARQPLTLPDRLPPQRSTAFRALGHCQTLRRLPPPRHQEPQCRCPHPPCRLRDCQ